MSKLEILQLLSNIFGPAAVGEITDGDPSGYHTQYFVDHEVIMQQIDMETLKVEQEIENERIGS